MSELCIVIEDLKLQYLHEKKAASIEIARIDGLNLTDLQNLIGSTMQENYIYNLRFDSEVISTDFM